MNDLGRSQLDVIRIRQIVTALVIDVDLLDFAAAEKLFSPVVTVDYTSLWGGEAASMARGDLIAGWRGLVPGFDATWHEVGEISVQLSGRNASASCAVAARHWIGAEVWLPKGRYEFGLVKGNGWRIAEMRLVLEAEIGDRALVERARARAASTAVPTKR